MAYAKWLVTPINKTPLNWEATRDIVIKQSHADDPLVIIQSHSRLKLEPVYYNNNVKGSLETIYTRRSILGKLEQFLQSLPEEIGILVLDAWRPFEVQSALREDFKVDLLAKYPSYSSDKIEEILNQFVALPSENPLCPSPHLTGGSIDLTLFDLASGDQLDMGSDFDEATPVSWSHYFEDKRDEKALQIRENRRLLINGMKSVGFTNLPSEWWHFDYGNQLWGYYNNQEAIYGIASINH